MIARAHPLREDAFEVDDLVAQLSDLRHLSQRRRYRGNTPSLPSRKTVIAGAFAEALRTVRARADSDARAGFEGDPSAVRVDEVIFSFPRFAAVLRHRLAHLLYKLGAPILAHIASEDSHGRTGVDIHPGAKIGEGFSIANGAGLSIGETAVIGRQVRIHQSVTLGDGFAVVSIAVERSVDDQANLAHRVVTPTPSRPEEGACDSRSRRHPLIEDGVVSHAGASLHGPIVVGEGSVIGRNVWLTDDVPPGVKIE